ncbi:MAG TPA: Zn-dependent hydrolase [Vicinamibacteria bacterium]|nr:Zn-dependent hydrolase [Vicinamibacteria bacterium]
MNRRRFSRGLALLALTPSLPAFAQTAPPLRTNAGRLRKRLEDLSVFGRPAGGTFADGVSRTGFSDADVEAHAWLQREMRTIGLEPKVDAAGNVSALRAGTVPGLAPILFGSHIDSVRGGGNFDGDVGSMSSLEVMATLIEKKVATRHPLEYVVWAAEESNFGSGLHGSRMAAGLIEEGEFERVQNGVTKREAMKRLGGDASRIAEARRARGSFHAYLELHIEQGGKLDRAGVPIGVVEGIVTIDDYDVHVRGFANHAGTTPMAERRDALVAASQIVQAVQQIANGEAGAQVGTVGQMTVRPNAPNVVPGDVEMTVEFRDLDGAKVARLGAALKERCAQIAKASNTEVEVVFTSRHEGARATPSIQAAIEKAAASLSLNSMRLPSGAGHDAQAIATLGPMGMIFVPSVAGISHSPRELSRWNEIAQGADVLMATILELDASAPWTPGR